MKQAELVQAELPGTDFIHVDMSQLKTRLEEAKSQLPESTWNRISHQAAKDKAWVQIALAVGAILACYIAPILGGFWGRRPIYFALSLLSLVSCAYLFRGLTLANGLTFWLMAFFVGGVTAAFYGWLPLYLPEIFPTRVRATGQGLAFNFGRILAAVGALNMGALVNRLGGNYASAGATITLIYVFGLFLIWLAPETKGKPLPD